MLRVNGVSQLRILGRPRGCLVFYFRMGEPRSRLRIPPGLLTLGKSTILVQSLIAPYKKMLIGSILIVWDTLRT